MDTAAYSPYSYLNSVSFTSHPSSFHSGQHHTQCNAPTMPDALSAHNSGSNWPPPVTLTLSCKTKVTERQSQARRRLTCSYNSGGQHWWKVCWIYNGSHLLDSARAKYSSLARSGRIEGRMPDVRKEATFTTLPRNIRLSSVSEQHESLASTYLNKLQTGQSNQEMVANNDDSFNTSTLPNLHLTESKSMTTLETKQPFFSFPSQLKLVDKLSLHKEMARFCSQQLNPSHILQSKITQPLAIWTKSKVDSQKNNIINLLTQYKGPDWRHQQLEYQMPIHDIELFRQPTAESRFIRNKQRKALVKSELFLAQHSNETCQKPIQINVASVKITLFESNNVSCSTKNVFTSNYNGQCIYHHYHIDCFTCFECEEILVDLKAYLHPLNENKLANNVVKYNLFCLRHFVEIYKPRCPYCDLLIFDEECTEAEGKAWHIGHFCCTECKRSLGGQQYIMASSEKKESVRASKQLPYCLTCFDILYGELCEECGELIGCEVGAIIHDGRSWHATDSCFRCSLCLKSLLGKPFLPALDGRIYCSLTCSQAMISHQKEKLRRQNKLHTLHSQKNSTLLNQAPEPKLDQNNKLQEYTNRVDCGNSIKEHRDQFLKSMTLNRYEQKLKSVQKDHEKIKILNLSQLVNYEKFIKQSNQFFTSKYDWSKEHEFVNIIDSNNEISSQTTGTFSDHNSEDNNLAQQLVSKCDLSSDCSNSVDIKLPLSFGRNRLDVSTSNSAEVSNVHYKTKEKMNLSNAIENVKADTELLSAAQSTSSSQSSSIRFQLSENSIQSNSPQINSNYSYYFVGKSSSPNSPCSNETAPSWAISPPPEYSKLGVDFKGENSSISSCQNFSKDSISTGRSNGILKPNTDNTMDQPADVHEEVGVANNESDSASFQALENAYQSYYSSSTAVEKPQSNVVDHHVIKSNSKSVSFDPNIEDKNERKGKSIRRVRSRYYRHEHDECSDSQSCSSCSTCTSSSSDDDSDGFDLSMVNYINNCESNHKSKTKYDPQSSSKSNQDNNESCTIS